VPGAKVLYSDIDPDNVEIGKQILADHPHCGYVYCDVTDLSSLDRKAMHAVLGAEGPLGLMLAGVACFIKDDLLQQTFERLFEMAPPNSYFAIDFDSFGMSHDDVKWPNYTMRLPETIRPLLGPWQPTPHGILPISLWQADQFNVQEPGEPVFHYGVVLMK
jgi:O-methyltransferase involved in polyketide biosynthesis